VVEACLGIPSWHWINGGKDRAVARAAFEAHLPAILIQRAGKGGPGQFVQSIYSINRDAIIARLRDGFLAQSGVLDIPYLEKPHDPTWRGQADAQKLMELLMAENWCQWWLRRTN
jgi:asparagine synthase (glutamine-hydrolysing)